MKRITILLIAAMVWSAQLAVVWADSARPDAGRISPARKRSGVKTKEGYVQEGKGDLDEWAAKLRDLQARSLRAGEETRAQLEKNIKALDKEIQEARKNLGDLQKSTESQWQKLRPGFDRALADIRRAYERVLSKLQGKHPSN
jgi:predicted  nucleic acid-binding Zn-ribbon protein